VNSMNVITCADSFFEYLMTLSEIELKLFLFLCSRTQSAPVHLLFKEIKKGTGLCKNSQIKATNLLSDKKLICRLKIGKKGTEKSIYSVNVEYILKNWK